MKIRSADFIASLAEIGDFPGVGMPEIVVVGKSNVGKSSMINRLTNRNKLARTSSEPGKTRLINLFNINQAFILVDLPGYGFAKVSRDEKQRWAGMIEGYLENSTHIKLAMQLVDLRHAPTKEDVAMVNYLRHYNLPFIVVGTKSDKLSRAERNRSLPVICRTLTVQPWQVIPFSSEDGTGCDQIYSKIEEAIAPEPELEVEDEVELDLEDEIEDQE